jgi:hypothetical protein
MFLADLMGRPARTRDGSLAEGYFDLPATEDVPALPTVGEALTRNEADLRYQQADLKIAPVLRNRRGEYLMTIEQTRGRGRRPASNDYNIGVNEAALVAFNARPSGSAFPHMLADPGKIWAIDHRMGIWMTKSSGERYRLAVNYGWHWSSASSRAVTPGLKVIQPNVCLNAEKCHSVVHKDYSQVLVLVTGWCVVKRPGESPEWRKTSAVYRSTELFRLVSHEASRPPHIRYDW